ncbi:hypothetical protein AAH978_02860 [Streptomyces sp. ZYX-F-203]
MAHSRPRGAAQRSCVAALLVTTVAGCSGTGEPLSAGATPTATGPVRLWPDLPVASSPAWDFGEAETETVDGVRVPGDDIRAVDPVTVVRAEIAAHPDDYTRGGATYDETPDRLDDCEGEEAATLDGREAAERTGDEAGCPLLPPFYRDLTGDGRADLALGFRLPPTDLTAVRVYTVVDHRLVRVMAHDDAVSDVELAQRSVIIRSPSEVTGYEYRLRWTWDTGEGAMLLTHDEMLRTGHHGRGAPGDSGAAARRPAAGEHP